MQDVFGQVAPYKIIDNFLGEALVQRLLEYARDNQPAFKHAGVGNRAKNKVNLEIRRALLLHSLGDLRTELEGHFRAVLNDTVAALRISPIKLHDLELQLVAHGDGAFYSEHTDTISAEFQRKSARALTAVYYFYRQPRPFEGGELVIHAIAPGGDGRRGQIIIEPMLDRLALFPAWLPHEVRPIRCPSGEFMDSRFAINCWYRIANPVKGA